MHKGRLEAFSDGVLAILITIMVLELKVPDAPTLEALEARWPIFASYALSYVILGIYWNNHHHLLQAAKHVSGAALWANLHLLFWLSLVPFVTTWEGESGFSVWPVVAYGVDLVMCGVGFVLLVRSLLAIHEPDSVLARAIGDDRKGKASLAIYLVSVALAFVWPGVAELGYALVAVMWLIPDRRIEDQLR